MPTAHELDGHVATSLASDHGVLIATPHHIQARCNCGWTGPDRTGDPHAAALVIDDTDWHAHQQNLPCLSSCLDCQPEEA